MRLVIHKEVSVRVPRRKLEELAEKLSRGERVPDTCEAHVIFHSSEAQRALNREYRGRDYDTDVLSFTYTPDERSPLLGEVYVSVDKAAEQAREYGHSLSGGFLRLVCHGLLHILGYDHDTEEAAGVMREREERYLALEIAG